MADFAGLFALEMRFAARVAELTGEPWDRVLASHTTFAHHAGLRQATPDAWRAFCDEVVRDPDPAAVVKRAFDAANEQLPPSPPSPFGCSSFDVDAIARRMRFHFRNADTSGRPPLSASRIPHRLQELQAMFATVRARHPEVQTVQGEGWLQGWRPYQRILPPEFVASMTPLVTRFNGMGVWGQFFDFRGGISPRRAAAFLARVDLAASLDDAQRAFPYPRLHGEVPIACFFEFHGIR